MMPLDVADHFRGTVSIWASVTSVDGSKQATFDDSTPVHKQLIDIKYSKDTRKQFKPGLPYKGKVRAHKKVIGTVGGKREEKYESAWIFISLGFALRRAQSIFICCAF